MSFNIDHLNNTSSGAALAPRLWTYSSSSDSLATVSGSGYFNTMIHAFKVGDLVWVVASDDEGWVKVTSVTTNVTVTSTI